MNKELKRAIVNWLLDHENEWQRTNICRLTFREYIFNAEGNFLIGGEEVWDFINNIDDVLYGRSTLCV